MHSKNDMTCSRREVLGALAGAAALGLAPRAYASQSSAQGNIPLRSLAAAKGILFGSALGAKTGTTSSMDDRQHVAVIARECGVIVPENEMKLYVIGADIQRPDFGPGDRIAAFARGHGMKLRGHTLLWNRTEYLPESFVKRQMAEMSRKDLESWLRSYIANVCGHYSEQVYSWDVVNETIDPTSGELRDTLFTRALGFDALRIAFETARDHAPNAQRVYNDYMSWEAGNEAHRKGVLKLLERFRREDIPVDALGIQSHIGTDGRHDQAQRQEWQAFVDAVVAMGYSLAITEFDVNDRSLSGDGAGRDAQSAAIAQDYLERMLSYPQLTQLLCWGMVDAYSWLQDFAPRDDRTPQRPLPYDGQYRAKPLRQAIAQALRSAPLR